MKTEPPRRPMDGVPGSWTRARRINRPTPGPLIAEKINRQTRSSPATFPQVTGYPGGLVADGKHHQGIKGLDRAEHRSELMGRVGCEFCKPRGWLATRRPPPSGT
jgi:hypothetical protein